MDGNGRWAQQRHFGRTRGHREGAKRVDEITTECAEIGVKYLTLYAFSTENWKRPLSEVSTLMRLMVQHLRTMDKKLIKNRISLTAQGTLERLPRSARTELDRVIKMSALPAPAMVMNICLSYGGRQEIVDAAKAIAQKAASGELDPEKIDEAFFQRHLYQPDIPEPDLLIRTGGECRVSNFLLWQIAYSEIVVTKTLWPDFGPAALHEALDEYGRRQRRYGLTQEQIRAQMGMGQTLQ